MHSNFKWRNQRLILYMSFLSRESNFANLLRIRFRRFKFHGIAYLAPSIDYTHHAIRGFYFQGWSQNLQNLRKLFPSKKGPIRYM